MAQALPEWARLERRFRAEDFASPPLLDDDYEPANDAEDVQDAVRAGVIPYDEVHCEHGTFIGTAGGPDYLCGQCEMGE